MKTVSIDPQEAAFYARLAETWWDKQGPFWPIHTLNAVRVEYLRGWMVRHFTLANPEQTPLQGLRVLDMGCGGGVLSESIARLGARVTGVDVVKRNIQVAQHHARQEGLAIDYRNTSAETLADESIAFDVVLNMEVVEHVADLPAFMEACNRLVRPGGLMFIATINRTFLAWWVAILGAEYILRWLPRGTHQWRKFPTPAELVPLLGRDHLEVKEQVGVLVNPFTRRMRLGSFTGVNYMLVAVKTGSSPTA
jgi:2-polyprenyl-6-hydroxyphenyl methylase/3-demethylubiquinone-9 3-methyltransferase